MKALLLFLVAALPAVPLRAADAPELVGGPGGRLAFVAGDAALFTLSPSLADLDWNFASPAFSAPTASPPAPGASFPFGLVSDGKHVTGDLNVASANGAVTATWNFTAKDAVEFHALVIATEFPLARLSGGSWQADAANGTFPAQFSKSGIFGGRVSSLVLTFPDKHEVKFAFPQPTDVVLQDDRQWGSATFTLRIGRGHGQMTVGETWSIAMTFTTPDGSLAYSHELPAFMKPVTLQADAQWVPLREDNLDIAPGSALDLSAMNFTAGPCGAKGRVIVTPGGHFAFAGDPDKLQRFYGVNLCFGASYLDRAGADQLLDRLVRLGYNAVRIHHYEGQLSGQKPGFAWDPAKVDELDYLVAGCAKRGIWITTDLFVSRPIARAQIGQPGPGNVDMSDYKILVLVSEPAFHDWCTFTRKLLDRVNPYTGKRLADEPALAWISLINEGGVANYWSRAARMPEWTAAWNKWLAARFPSRDQLAAAIGDLGANEDAAKKSVTLPPFLDAKTPRGQLAEVFVAATEKSAFERMRRFLRTEIKCPALLTNMNDTGATVMPLAGVRSDYDYVDQHFYVDHPQFLGKSWQLPSKCSNVDPVASGAPGGTSISAARIWGKPFTVTEFNYAAPSRYRAVGGPLTGALAALQGWDALWRFDYAASDQTIFTPAHMHYFDLVSDPLNQAADRLAVLLFLRGDVTTAPGRLAMIILRKALDSPTPDASLSPLQEATWRTRVGALVVDDPTIYPSKYDAVPLNWGTTNDWLPGPPPRIAPDPSELHAPLQPAADAVAAALDQLKLGGDVAGNTVRSQTGEITLAPADAVLTIDTPRDAGGFAEVGKTIDATGAGVRIEGVTTAATIFVSSLDGAPIRESKRLLVTHLTDLQNSGAKFAEGARQTLEAWGNVPYLVRDGAATLRLTLKDPASYRVWALAPSGERRERIDATIHDGQLVFTASVRGPDSARMLYEIAP
jgi:hypothetical protein